MGIVNPARESGKGRAPILNGGKSGGSVAEGGIVTPVRGSKGAAPLVNGKSGGELPGYGSYAAGPYNPTKQPQSTRSSAKPLS